MPRGFHRMENETAEAYRFGLLVDKRKRSFIGRKPDGSTHLLLFGADKNWMHDKIIEDAKERCEGCDEPHFVPKSAMEWDHINHKPWNRCDCEANGRGVCNAFHVRRHTKRFKEAIMACPGIDIEEFLGREAA